MVIPEQKNPIKNREILSFFGIERDCFLIRQNKTDNTRETANTIATVSSDVTPEFKAYFLKVGSSPYNTDENKANNNPNTIITYYQRLPCPLKIIEVASPTTSKLGFLWTSSSNDSDTKISSKCNVSLILITLIFSG